MIGRAALAALFVLLLSTTTVSAAGTTVNIQSSTYSPASPKIARGQTITWVNKDYFGHTATSDVPGGVVNIITGRTAEVAPWLASHRDVNAIDLTGAAGADGVDWGALEAASADNLKRVLRPGGTGVEAVEPDFAATPDLSRLTAFLETKTVWHPKGR